MKVLLALLLFATPAAATDSLFRVSLGAAVVANALDTSDIWRWRLSRDSARCGERSFDSPATEKARSQDLKRESDDARPICDGHSSSAERQSVIRPAIVGLFSPSRPPAIRLGVGTIVVDSVDRRVLWRAPHIAQESLKVGPFYGDAASTVVFVVRVCLTPAATTDVVPRSQLKAPSSMLSFAVGYGACPDFLDSEASTTFDVPSKQVLCANPMLSRAAGTAAEESPLAAILPRRVSDDGQASEGLADTFVSRYEHVQANVPQSSADPTKLLFRLTLGTAVVASSLDLASTVDCRARKTCTESNPWLLRFERPIPFTLAKTTVSALTLWATAEVYDRCESTKCKAFAIGLNVAQTVGFSLIAAHNLRVGR